MCGIILTKSEDPLLLNSISHRGIESSLESIEGVTLCHHRLPIQTLDGDNWNQPIEVSDGVYLMFNGEIYNYDKEDYDSDTEYLANFFRGVDISNLELFVSVKVPEIQTWDGFWAVVLYDSRSGDILSFTDPLGRKILYRNIDGEICSEIKGVFKNEYRIDERFISSVRKWGYNTDQKTPYLEIERILPNTIYSYNINSPLFVKRFDRYYNAWDYPIFELKEASYKDHMDWLWDKMFESVKNRLVSKGYPISLLISGGLDSSIIAAILKEIGADVTWFSIENGESEYVRDLSFHLDNPVEFLDYDMGRTDVNSEIYKKWNEGPIDLGSVIPQYYLFDSIRKKTDHRIVISGDGADELFGGYRRILEYDSQKSDIFDELTFYHLPRLDKMSMAHTLELRNPFLNLDIVRFASNLPFEWRKEKKILKDTFSSMLPTSIVERAKAPLKNPEIKKDKIAYRHKAVDIFLK